MHKRLLFKRLIIFFLAISAIALGISPFISLLLPEKISRRSYHDIIYQAIADSQTKGLKTEKEKFLSIFQYVLRHQFLQGTPDESKPFDSLVSGEAYCDFQSRTLNSLLAACGIRSRYAMLLDKNQESPHTLNEVCLKDSCYITDPALNFIFEDDSGRGISLKRLSDEPGLIYRNRKISALKEYNQPEYERWSNFFPTVFPMPFPARLSKINTLQLHILDYIAVGYFKLLGRGFLDFYQDLYLSLKKKKLEPQDAKLFYYARSYHLAGRYEPAEKDYGAILKDYPESKYRDDVVFFTAMLYFDRKDYLAAADAFNTVANGVSGKWKDAAYYYLGLIYSLLGDTQQSCFNYSRTPVIKLSAQDIEFINASCKNR